jgi:hypothetical protein
MMSSEMAARYLSVDELTLFRLADQFNTLAVEITDLPIKWRKQDLDRQIKKLPMLSPGLKDHNRSRLFKLESKQLKRWPRNWDE